MSNDYAIREAERLEHLAQHIRLGRVKVVEYHGTYDQARPGESFDDAIKHQTITLKLEWE